MYVLTITERTPTPAHLKDTNTYHVICADLVEVAGRIEKFEYNFGVLVSATIAPWKE